MSARLFFLSDDARILDLIRRGDEQALARLYEANSKMVASFIARNNGTHDDYEDMLQEALVILWERVRSGRFEYGSKLSTFLFATVRNIWLRRLARMKREIPSDLLSNHSPDTGESVLDMMIEEEEALAVRNALDRIGEQCKKILTLFYWEECSTAEIAERMGFANAETAKSKKYQCKKALEKILKQTTERYA
jgi:RNA polymerase sigma factor (sigma-70 family)